MRKITKIVISFMLMTTMVLSFASLNNVKAAVGDTIAQTFPDANFAQAIADKVAGGNVNAEFTQAMVDNMTRIEFSEANISDITGIEKFTNLTYADFYKNNITQLPDGFDTLDNLEYLALGSNKFNTVPDILYNLKNLKRLFLGENNLTSISDKIGNLTTLVELNLNNNRLTELPSSIGDLKNLTSLLATDNNLTSLPDSITNLSSLQFLVAYRNQITSLPVNFGQLSNLVGVSLENNQLSNLPESFGDLSNLTILYLENNQLTSLPLGMGNFTKLVAFAIRGNLLPTNYNDILNEIGLELVVPYEEQRQLTLRSGLSPYEITNANDLNNINLFSTVAIDLVDVSPSHNLILENYVDGNGTPVEINDFISNGKVIKEGSLFAQVRATGTGLFPNNSDHALTVDKIQLDFKVSYNLSFDLNGGEGIAPTTQTLLEGATAQGVTDPVRTGYGFKGWNTNANGSGTTWDLAVTPMPGNNVTLYAQWEADEKPLPPTAGVNAGDDTNVIGFSMAFVLAGMTLLIIRNTIRKNNL